MDETVLVERYVEAAGAGHAAEARSALALVQRASAVRVVPQLLPWLGDRRPAVSQAACTAALTILPTAPLRSLWAVDRAVRERGAWGVASIAPEHLARLAMGTEGLGAIALLSMQRNGYTRERAVSWLVSRTEGWILRLLLLRLNDPVRPVAEAAADALRPWLNLRRAPRLVEVLPLVETMRHTVRAAHSGVADRVDVLLSRGGEAVRQALRYAAREAIDEDVRAHAVLRLAAGPLDDAVSALRQGLSDRSPRVRMAAARFIERTSISVELRQRVLPALHDNASPSLRLLSLRLRRGDDSAATRAALLERSFDAHAVVRYHARRQLRTLGDRADFYALARERLESGGGSGALIGALAVLSDLGRRADIERVRSFIEHPVRRVAAEARRTLEILEQG